ncbi:molybdopterin converting factor subunit 1 [soil metagenome]
MNYKILLFGITKDIIGKPEIDLDFPSSVKVNDILSKLKAEYPALKSLNSLVVAVNNEYAETDETVKEADEIALIPPVSGG